MKSLPETIIARRKELGISQQALAEMAGIRIASLCQFETGKSSLASKSVEKVLKILKLEVK